MLHWLIVERNPQAPPRHHQKNAPTKTTAGQTRHHAIAEQTRHPLSTDSNATFCGVDSFFSSGGRIMVLPPTRTTYHEAFV